MPTGTGKTITLLSLITSYQLAHPEVGKLVYCTRTVPEMEKVLVELGELVAYRARYFTEKGQGGETRASNGNRTTVTTKHKSPDAPPQILALGLSSRKNLCVNPDVADEASRESADAKCRRLTASWVRERAQRARGAARGGNGGDEGEGCDGACGGGGIGEGRGEGTAANAPASTTSIEDIGNGNDNRAPSLCAWHEGLEAAGGSAVLDPGVYTLADLRAVGRKKKWCPYFLARHMLAFANVIGKGNFIGLFRFAFETERKSGRIRGGRRKNGEKRRRNRAAAERRRRRKNKNSKNLKKTFLFSDPKKKPLPQSTTTSTCSTPKSARWSPATWSASAWSSSTRRTTSTTSASRRCRSP
jgi:hypothetical protein